jgi:hypothetical protein
MSYKELSAQSASISSVEQWIAVWKDASMFGGNNITSASLTAGEDEDLTATACSEGEAAETGRFNATCMHAYSATIRGFAASFSRQQVR